MGKGRGKVDSVLNAGVEDSCETFNMEGGGAFRESYPEVHSQVVCGKGKNK